MAKKDARLVLYHAAAISALRIVIPARTGIRLDFPIPASAGMTESLLPESDEKFGNAYEQRPWDKLSILPSEIQGTTPTIRPFLVFL